MCVLCVQLIATWRSEIEDPYTSEWRREWLKKEVQKRKSAIQVYKLQIDGYETEIKQIEREIKQKETSGESIKILNDDVYLLHPR